MGKPSSLKETYTAVFLFFSIETENLHRNELISGLVICARLPIFLSFERVMNLKFLPGRQFHPNAVSLVTKEGAAGKKERSERIVYKGLKKINEATRWVPKFRFRLEHVLNERLEISRGDLSLE